MITKGIRRINISESEVVFWRDDFVTGNPTSREYTPGKMSASRLKQAISNADCDQYQDENAVTKYFSLI